jgi:site-specific DNA-methyltransferase (adenine-specific)
MFVFVKGKIRNDITLLAEHENKWAGCTNFGKQTQYNKDGLYEVPKPKHVVPSYSLNENIWDIVNACDKDNKKYHHPAIFPEKLADMHIKSWLPSDKECVIFDPFMGSATTGKMALANGHSFIGSEIVHGYFLFAEDRLRNYYPNIKINENKLPAND